MLINDQLTSQLRSLGLTAVDAGGGGDCFFKAIVLCMRHHGYLMPNTEVDALQLRRLVAAEVVISKETLAACVNMAEGGAEINSICEAIFRSNVRQQQARLVDWALAGTHDAPNHLEDPVRPTARGGENNSSMSSICSQ